MIERGVNLTDRGYDMSEREDLLCKAMFELESDIVDKIYTMIDCKWDADTLRRDIELQIMEHRSISKDLHDESSI